MKKLTLEEVGKIAGVSRATVSRVINKPDSVTPELRARVEKVIAETGYRPNPVARSLASNRSNILGLIIPNVAQNLFTDPYFTPLIEGISQACNAHDYTLALFIFHSEEEEEQVFKRALGTGLLDGLIAALTSLTNTSYMEQIVNLNLPYVNVGRPADDQLVSYVDVDSVAGAFLATQHLIRLGYQRIAHIAAPLDTTVGLDRKQGYVNALNEAGIRLNENLIGYGNLSQDSGYIAMRQLLNQQPDAVFVASDRMGVGVYRAIYDAGLRIPDDIAIVGFDDLPPAVSVTPPMSTVRQPVTRLGLTAVEILMQVIETGPTSLHHIVLPTELVIRASCGAMQTRQNY